MDDIEKAVEEAMKDSGEGAPEALENNVDVLKEQLSKTEAFAKQAIARAKKAEAEAKALKVSAAPKEHVEDKPAPSGDSLETRVELRLQGFDKSAVEFIMNNGGLKALENPFIKKTVELMSEQSRAEKAQPDADSGKSEIEKKYTQEQLKNMSAEELYKILPKSTR